MFGDGPLLLAQFGEGHAGDVLVHFPGQELLHGLPGEYGRVQALAELQQNLVIGLAFAHLDGLVDGAQEHRQGTVVRGHDAVLLGEGRNGKEQVAEGGGGRRHEQVVHYVELQFLERGVPALGGAAQGQAMGLEDMIQDIFSG